MFYTDMHGETSLHWACRNGHRACALALLEVDPEMKLLEMKNTRGVIAHKLAKKDGVLRLMNDFHEKLDLKHAEEEKKKRKLDIENKVFRKKKARGMSLLRKNIRAVKGLGASNLTTLEPIAARGPEVDVERKQGGGTGAGGANSPFGGLISTLGSSKRKLQKLRKGKSKKSKRALLRYGQK